MDPRISDDLAEQPVGFVPERMRAIAEQVGQDPWPDLDIASLWFDRASLVLIVSLFAGFVATAIIVWMGIVKERHWDVLRESSQNRIAILGLETAQANQRAAEADERTAKLNVALEAERQKRLPRRLDLHQIQILDTYLSKETRKV